MKHGFKVFIGEADNAELAAEAVERKINAWLDTHDWRLPDGRSAYDLTLMVQRVEEGWWICVVTTRGPLDPT